jgi:uncharacterized protein (TIGR03435 family)
MCALSFAQSTPPRLEFEVATVKAAAPGIPGQVPVGLHVDGAQVSFRGLSLQDYILSAYNIKKHQLAGPDWISTERYDIQGKVPDGTPSDKLRDNMRDMLQSLLEDRFKLKTHHETREMPVYALVVAKSGLKMKETPADPELEEASKKAVDVTVNAGRGGTMVKLPNGASIMYGFLFLEAKRVTMQALADNLARMVDRPVIDDTALKGGYDFKLEYSIEELRSMMRTSGTDVNMLAGVPDNMGTTVLTSLQTLGLRLESRKAPMDVLVVDRAEKTPTEN